MSIFEKSKKKVLKELLKASSKKEKEIEKDFQKRNSTKYNDKNLKLSKDFLMQNAMTIDTEEYKKMVEELKMRTIKEDIPD